MPSYPQKSSYPLPQQPPQAQQQPPQQKMQEPPAPAKQPPSAVIEAPGKKVTPAANTHFVEKKIGEGGMGVVFAARHAVIERPLAIKVLKKEFIIENDEVESTRSEKRVFLIANKERHPFLLSLHACFQTETRVYFVMEYISGGDLMLHIQRGQFGTKRAQYVYETTREEPLLTMT